MKEKIVDGISWNVDWATKVGKADFVKDGHANYHYQHIPEDKRKQVLENLYDILVPPVFKKKSG